MASVSWRQSLRYLSSPWVVGGQLDAFLENTFPWATLSAAGALLVGGLLTVWLGWRRFRHDFLGLRESLEECREDIIWLREWVGGP